MIVEITVVLFSVLAIFYSGYFLLMWKKSHEWNFHHNCAEDVNLSVSVIIPAYNEEKIIVRKLENLLQQDYPNMDIIVVNDGSTDRTAITVRDFIERNLLQHKVQLLSLPRRKGKASAINHGLQHCGGEIIIISDADTILEGKAIERIVQVFLDPRVGGVTGKLSMINYGESFSTELEKNYRNVFDILRLGESCMDSTPIFNGALVALRRHLFDPLSSDTLADDTEIALRVREKGYKTIFDPTATVYSFTPKSFKSRTEQKIRRAQGIIQSFNRHKSILFRPAYGKYGLIILPCEFFMHIISPFLFLLATALLLFAFLSVSINIAQIILVFSMGVIIFGLMFVVLKYSSKNGSSINPIRFFTTFLEHQVFLMLGLFFLLLRKGNVKWKKIES